MRPCPQAEHLGPVHSGMGGKILDMLPSPCLFNFLSLSGHCGLLLLLLPLLILAQTGAASMVPKPNIVHAVVVHNDHSEPMHVTVVYDDHKHNKELSDAHIVLPNAQHVFEGKTLDMGGWQAVAPVTRVTAGREATNHAATLLPKVKGIVKQLHVHVKGGTWLEQGVAA